MSVPLRAAVIGGTGFGKFHAQWYAREGAEVVAYTATTDDTLEAAGRSIHDLTGQTPKGYTDVEQMLTAERPDVVSVCTPPALHREPVLAALDAGAHVLCEKPIQFDPNLSGPENLSISGEMIEKEREANRLLAVNQQYAALLEPYLEMFAHEWEPLEEVLSYDFEMESKGNRNGPHRYEQIWVELGPHALTPLLMSLPNASVVEESLQTELSESEVRVRMELHNPNGHRIKTGFRLAACDKDAVPLRRFGFNGFLVDIAARKDEDGTPLSVLSRPEGGRERICDDFMRVSIRRFLGAAGGDGVPLVTAEEAHRNLSVILTVLDRLKGGDAAAPPNDR